jgi:hypothetical protein
MPDIFDASEIAYTCVTAEKVKINRISLITLHFAAFPAIRSPRRETELKDRARSACMRHLLFAEINLFGCQKICGHVCMPMQTTSEAMEGKYEKRFSISQRNERVDN